MQNSSDQLDSDQDQRKSAGMEDSTVMTIEFLRARLLAERSVSSAARQKADELTKRVLELEEQLNIVSLQRKKAEKATTDLLAILENRGISELSEDFDSSSDQDVIHCESKVSNNLPEEEGSVDSKMRRNPTDDCSSCELESSHLSGRSLSWKSGKDSHCSHEKKKYIDSSSRRRSAFASTASASPRRRVGKSCRQIRHRETRSAVEDTRIDNSMLASQENGVATYSEDFPTQSAIVTESFEENYDKRDAKVLDGPVSGDSENQRLVVNARNYLNVHGSDKDMERALEHQAKLIGQYEEEEKAQREWEEKFRETNNSTPDSCEPGNHSDVTEERDEAKTHSPLYPVETVASHNQEESSKVENAGFTKDSSKSQSNGLRLSANADMGCYQDQKPTNMLAHESPPASDFVFPVAPGKQDQQGAGNYIIPPSHGYHRSTQLEGPAGNQSVDSVASHSGSSFCKGDTSGSKNELSALMQHETPNKLGSVLGALHQAKLSITQKLNGSAIDGDESVQKAIEFPVADRPEVPLGCAGLFRVPSDFLEGTAKASILGSNSRLSLTNYYPDAGRALTAVDPFTKYYPDAGSAPTAAVDPFKNYFPDAGHALTAVDPFITHRHAESGSSVSNGGRHLAFPTSIHEESRPKIPCWEPLERVSRFPPHKPLFGLSFDMGVPSSSRYAYNNPNMDRSVALSSAYTSTSSSYPDAIPSSSRYAYNTPNMDRSVSLPSAYTSTSSSYPDAIPYSSRYAYNTSNMDRSVALPGAHTSTSPFYPETASQLPPDRGARLFSSSRAGMPPANNFSFYDDHIRPNMYG